MPDRLYMPIIGMRVFRYESSRRLLYHFVRMCQQHAHRLSTLPRSLAVLWLQDGKAALAAAIADLVSAAFMQATLAMISFVAGLLTCCHKTGMSVRTPINRAWPVGFAAGSPASTNCRIWRMTTIYKPCVHLRH